MNIFLVYLFFIFTILILGHLKFLCVGDTTRFPSLERVLKSGTDHSQKLVKLAIRPYLKMKRNHYGTVSSSFIVELFELSIYSTLVFVQYSNNGRCSAISVTISVLKLMQTHLKANYQLIANNFRHNII